MSNLFFLLLTVVNFLMVALNVPGMMNGNIYSICAGVFCASCAGFVVSLWFSNKVI